MLFDQFPRRLPTSLSGIVSLFEADVNGRKTGCAIVLTAPETGKKMERASYGAKSAVAATTRGEVNVASSVHRGPT